MRSRRLFSLQALTGTVSLALHAPLLAQLAATPHGRPAGKLRIAQSASLSGPQSDAGLGFSKGAKAAFAAVNAAGGVHGRLIEFVSEDDGDDVNRTLRNTEQFLAMGEGTLALIGYTGTASTKAAIPLAKAAGVVMFAPITGSDDLQAEFHPHVFFVRGTHSDEILKILQHLTTIGSQRIGVLHPADSLGQRKMALVMDFASRHQLPVPKSVAYDTRSPDMTVAAKALREGQVQTVLHLTSSQYSGQLLKALDGVHEPGAAALNHYGVSNINATDLVRVAGKAAHGFVIAKRVPNPAGTSTIVAEFRSAMQAQPSASKADVASAAALEGYIAARLLIKALWNAGPRVDRAALRNALEALGRQEMGTFAVAYGPGKHRGSSFVDLAMVRDDMTVAR